MICLNSVCEFIHFIIFDKLLRNARFEMMKSRIYCFHGTMAMHFPMLSCRNNVRRCNITVPILSLVLSLAAES